MNSAPEGQPRSFRGPPRNKWTRRRWAVLAALLLLLVSFAFSTRDRAWSTAVLLGIGLPFLLAVFTLARLDELMSDSQEKPTRGQVAAAFRAGLVALLVVVVIGVVVIVAFVSLAK
jgi:hypothetical protein